MIVCCERGSVSSKEEIASVDFSASLFAMMRGRVGRVSPEGSASSFHHQVGPDLASLQAATDAGHCVKV